MKLACFDIDGTLLPSYDQSIPQDVLSAIQSFADKGNAIAIASGRPFGSVKALLDIFHAPNRFAICAGGSTLFDDQGNLLWKQTLNKEQFFHFAEELKPNTEVAVYCYLGDDSLASYFPEPWADFEFGINHFSCHHDLNQDDSVIDRFGVTKIMIAAYPEVSAKITFSKEDYENFAIVRSNAHFLEVMPKGVSKASAIELMRQRLNIDKEEIYTFGDSGNDLEMVKDYVGVAMGNATEDVKEVAKYITKDCKDSGVAYALKDILHLI